MNHSRAKSVSAPRSSIARMIDGSAWLVILLVVLPLGDLLLAYQTEPPLFESPPLSWSTLGRLLLRTLALGVIVSAASLSLGTWLAWLETRCDYAGRGILAIASTLPLAVPSYMMAAVVRETMAPRGTLGNLLGTSTPFTGLLAAGVVLTLSCTPYVQVLVRAAIVRTSASTEEAAQLLGASAWRRFVHLTVPQLRPTWAFSLIIVSFYVISDFGAVAVLDCEVLTWALYQSRHDPRDVVQIGGILIAVVIPTMMVIRSLHGRAEVKRSMGHPRPLTRTKLSTRHALLAYVSHAVIILPGLVLPLTALVSWVAAGIASDQSFIAVGQQVQATLIYTTTGAALTLVCALAPAWSVARGRSGAAMEHLTYLTSGLPGILVAVGIFYVLLSLRGVGTADSGDGWLETSGAFLMFGYIMRYLSEGYAAIKPTVLRLDLRHEESAQTLGASPGRIFRTITLPALSPGLVAGYTLLFIAIAKELPITLMLTPLGEQTLAYRIFDAQQEGALPDAGLSALILLVLALSVQLLLSKGWKHD